MTIQTRPRLPLYLAVLALLAAVPVPLAADGGEPPPDRVLLDQGDRLSGEVVKVTGGVLHLATDYAGTVEIELARVRSVETAAPVTVELASGERLEGRLAAGDPAELRIVTEHAGEPLAVAFADVAAVNPPPEVSYHFAVSVGANVQSGNTSRTSIAVGADAEHETPTGRFRGTLTWNTAEESGERTARNTYAGLQYDFLFGGPRYLYVKANFLADEFKDLDLRTVAGVGLGYEAVANDRLDLDLEAGLAFLSEDFTTAPDQEELTVDVGATADWHLGRWGTLSESLTIRPSFDEGSYQLRFANTLRSKLALGWALKLQNVLDYDSEPPPGVEKEDLLWIVALEYVFE